MVFKIYYSIDESKPEALKIVAIIKASNDDDPTWSQSIKADRKKKWYISKKEMTGHGNTLICLCRIK